jgi:hypothetical protein
MTRSPVALVTGANRGEPAARTDTDGFDAGRSGDN